MYFLRRQNENCFQTNKYLEKDINKNVFKNYTDKFLSQTAIREEAAIERARQYGGIFSRRGRSRACTKYFTPKSQTLWPDR